MNNVVSLHAHIDARWSEYVAAQKRAQQTLSIDDGIAAARAWSRWLELFMREDQKEFIGKSRASA
jgi:predicted nucleic acid-binding protein